MVCWVVLEAEGFHSRELVDGGEDFRDWRWLSSLRRRDRGGRIRVGIGL